MANHRVYSAIVYAVKSGRLKEPFSREDFRKACPSFGEGTYTAFLDKHRRGNPRGNSELFERVAPGCKRFPFAEAFELLFKCPTCNKPMMHINNDWIVKVLTRKIEQIKVQ